MPVKTMSLGRWSKLFEALADQADRDAITAPLALRASISTPACCSRTCWT